MSSFVQHFSDGSPVWTVYHNLAIIQDLWVVKYKRQGKRTVLCKCTCWKHIPAILTHLKRWWIKSCWCSRITHGMYNTRENNSWNSMKERCYLVTHRHYKNYWGRWIVVCDEWKNSFQQFFADMCSRPLGHSLDRINNNWNYEPWNCKWSTPKEQAQNRRTRTFTK